MYGILFPSNYSGQMKNFVFVSPSFSHSSLDFCCHMRSFLFNYSWSCIYKCISVLIFSIVGYFCWMDSRAFRVSFIFSSQFLKCFLFHSLKAIFVHFIFFENLKALNPKFWVFQAFLIALEQAGSLVHVAKNL